MPQNRADRAIRPEHPFDVNAGRFLIGKHSEKLEGPNDRQNNIWQALGHLRAPPDRDVAAIPHAAAATARETLQLLDLLVALKA
jgi:hypothetical protein